MNSQLSKIRSVHTYICHTPDGLLWFNLYTVRFRWSPLSNPFDWSKDLDYSALSEYYVDSQEKLSEITFNDLR